MPEVLAVYEKGQLRPLKPLSLSEQQRVRIRIMPEQPLDKADKAIQHLIQSHLLTPPSESLTDETISESERRQLADTLAKAAKRTLSEIVTEERAQW